MEDLSLHVLDVAQNALAAGASRIEIRIIDEPKGWIWRALGWEILAEWRPGRAAAEL